MLNIDGINNYTKTMTNCDDEMVAQVFVGQGELKIRLFGHCAMLDEDAMNLGTEADVSVLVLDIKGMNTFLNGVTGYGSRLSVISIET